ncbi:class I SAM-dependent methyltransferase [Nocardia mangyaensis]|uniref:class I SAM-dependent methyltransferase n=1 Tax=Nocardia mangyaensis TaxID=2213200 RepID=UPI002674878A|nr:class I SAM-dependent methyltransferase [Nocardia mangyaensis]MDO3647970.1 class I SAM-dependent methyltransferase [Nocardia mangyaensis]
MTDDGDLAARQAQRAQSFGTQAAVYAEHRPGYAAASIRWALEPLGDKDSPVILDLGAGTGKLTEGLLAVGAEVIAVEPDDAMRAELVRRFPGVTALSGAAEEIPLPDRSVDAVVAGQAFHWFDQARAFPEIARVLRAGGVFAAFWNRDDERVAWVVGLEQVVRTDASFTPTKGSIRRLAHPLFTEFEHAEFDHTHRRTAESLTATIGTHSHTVVIPPAQRAELLDRTLAYLRRTPETARGEFDFPLRTDVLRATRRADVPE